MDNYGAPQRYFLGANTAEGFTSFYHEFLHPEEGDFLWYIKGGPGNGKSTLMRTVARAAEDQGKTVEYAFCSGDPDSLDGIYIREDRVGYVDATSPHVQEPGEPGASGRYLDLSGCYRPGLGAHREEIRDYFRRYREQYARSYELLRAAALSTPDATPGLVSQADRAEATEKAAELAERLVTAENGYRAEHRILSAYTCKGRVSFWEEVNAERFFTLDNTLGLADDYLREFHNQCRATHCHVILCPDPLRPMRLEGLILPAQGLAIAAIHRSQSSSREHISLGHPLTDSREEYQRCKTMQGELLWQAEQSLREAKRLHDKLEAVYRPFVDFSAVDEIIREHVRKI